MVKGQKKPLVMWYRTLQEGWDPHNYVLFVEKRRLWRLPDTFLPIPWIRKHFPNLSTYPQAQ